MPRSCPRRWAAEEGDADDLVVFPREGSVPDENSTDTDSEGRQRTAPSRQATYEWRQLLSSESFRFDDYEDYEEGEEPAVPLGYLVEFNDIEWFMQHKDAEHGTFPILQHNCEDMLKALREQVNLPPDHEFGNGQGGYGYILNRKRKWLGG